MILHDVVGVYYLDILDLIIDFFNTHFYMFVYVSTLKPACPIILPKLLPCRKKCVQNRS